MPRHATSKIEPFYENAFYKELGQRIKAMRIMRGYSQAILGKFIGVTFQQIQKYESGANWVPIINLVRLSKLFSEEFSALLPDIGARKNGRRLPTADLELLRALHSIHDDAPIREMILKLGKAS
jgi:transcriptional regulator with XRE-family HTH domain